MVHLVTFMMYYWALRPIQACWPKKPTTLWRRCHLLRINKGLLKELVQFCTGSVMTEMNKTSKKVIMTDATGQRKWVSESQTPVNASSQNLVAGNEVSKKIAEIRTLHWLKRPSWLLLLFITLPAQSTSDVFLRFPSFLPASAHG